MADLVDRLFPGQRPPTWSAWPTWPRALRLASGLLSANLVNLVAPGPQGGMGANAPMSFPLSRHVGRELRCCPVIADALIAPCQTVRRARLSCRLTWSAHLSEIAGMGRMAHGLMLVPHACVEGGPRRARPHSAHFLGPENIS